MLDLDNLIDPHTLAEEIVKNLEGALDGFRVVFEIEEAVEEELRGLLRTSQRRFRPEIASFYIITNRRAGVA